MEGGKESERCPTYDTGHYGRVPHCIQSGQRHEHTRHCLVTASQRDDRILQEGWEGGGRREEGGEGGGEGGGRKEVGYERETDKESSPPLPTHDCICFTHHLHTVCDPVSRDQ